MCGRAVPRLHRSFLSKPANFFSVVRWLPSTYHPPPPLRRCFASGRLEPQSEFRYRSHTFSVFFRFFSTPPPPTDVIRVRRVKYTDCACRPRGKYGTIFTSQLKISSFYRKQAEVRATHVDTRRVRDENPLKHTLTAAKGEEALLHPLPIIPLPTSRTRERQLFVLGFFFFFYAFVVNVVSLL